MLRSLAAAGAGVVTVSLAAMTVEQVTAKSVPKFNPKRERFDASTYGGRFAQMLLACDPRLLLYNKEQVQQAKSLLENYGHGNNNNHRNSNTAQVSDHALWEAKRIVTAALHADTGEVIPRPFRMSGKWWMVLVNDIVYCCFRRCRTILTHSHNHSFIHSFIHSFDVIWLFSFLLVDVSGNLFLLLKYLDYRVQVSSLSMVVRNHDLFFVPSFC